MSFFKRLSTEFSETYKAAGIKTIEKAAFPERKGFYYNLSTDNGRLAPPPYFLTKNVTIFDPFLSFSDLQNDVKALFIKPLVCLFLARYHAQKFIYELALSAIHLCTFSPRCALEHGVNSFESAAKAFIYGYSIIAEFCLQALSLVMRGVISVGSGLKSVISRDEAHTLITAPETQRDFIRNARTVYFNSPA